MRRITPSILLLLSFSSWSQVNTKFIEVMVNEKVQLKVESIQISLSVYSEEQQMEEIYESAYEVEEDVEYLEEYPEYSEESEHKLSAAERKEREKEQEEREAFELERQARLEQEIKDFDLYTLQELMSSLRAENIPFEIQAMAMSDDYEEWSDMVETGAISDSILLITLLDEASDERLQALILDKPIELELREIIYESADRHILDLAPKMTERAKKQAEGLALSVGKKAGAIVNISNVYPGFSPSLMENQFEQVMEYTYRSKRDKFSFKSTKPSFIEMIYRFALVD